VGGGRGQSTRSKKRKNSWKKWNMQRADTAATPKTLKGKTGKDILSNEGRGPFALACLHQVKVEGAGPHRGGLLKKLQEKCWVS